MDITTRRMSRRRPGDDFIRFADFKGAKVSLFYKVGRIAVEGSRLPVIAQWLRAPYEDFVMVTPANPTTLETMAAFRRVCLRNGVMDSGTGRIYWPTRNVERSLRPL